MRRLEDDLAEIYFDHLASSWIRRTHHGWNPHCPTMWVCPPKPGRMDVVHSLLPSLRFDEDQASRWTPPSPCHARWRVAHRNGSTKKARYRCPWLGSWPLNSSIESQKKMGKFTLFSCRSLGWRGMTYGWTAGVSGHFAWQRESLKCDRVPLHHIAELTMLTLDLLAVVSCSSFLVVMVVLTHWFRTKVPCILGRSHVDLKLSPGSSPERLLMNHYLQKKIVHQRPRRIPL